MSYNTGIGTRTAVVTGAGSLRGIGYQTAKRFVQEGWAVLLVDVNADGLETVESALSEEFPDGQIASRAFDITDPDAVKTAATEVAQSDMPPVGALANIAGIPSPQGFFDLTLDAWNKVLNVNLTGAFIMSQAFVPQMIEGGYGRVVNMSSVTAQHGGGVFSKTAYAAAKAGVLGLTRGLAKEVAEYGITVNAVAPGVVDTDIRVGGTDDDTEKKLAEAVPLKRQAEAWEIAALTVWLCSEDAAYITGNTHSINGGTYIV